jgi:O-acetyl-ADP-ribose deacetylase (regulator of RNase III)
MKTARSYQFGPSRLTICFGDIVSAEAQVIVSSDDYYITMGGGVSAAILRAGGAAILLDAAKRVPAALGDVVVTTAGTLKAQYIFHAITIGPNPNDLSHADVVERTTRRCMRLLDGLQLTSIAFPAIGAGVARFSIEEVAAMMAEVVASELASRTTGINVSIVLFDRDRKMTELDLVRFFEEFAARVPRLATKLTDAPAPLRESEPGFVDLATETHEEYKRRRIHNLRGILAELEEQRGKLERRLIAVETDDAAQDRSIRDALGRNQELRLTYLTELQSYMASPDAVQPVRKPGPLSVFVSSTSLDLVAHRAAVRDAIARCDLFFRGMEHFGASADGQPPAKLIVEEVRKADVYVGVFGVRYGSVDPATGLSMTELEFREAETSKKPMLLYVMHQEAAVPVAHIETDADGLKKLAALKAHLAKQYVTYLFRTAEDLGRQSQLDLVKLKAGA